MDIPKYAEKCSASLFGTREVGAAIAINETQRAKDLLCNTLYTTESENWGFQEAVLCYIIANKEAAEE